MQEISIACPRNLIRMNTKWLKNFLFLLIVLLFTIIPASASTSGNSITYSFVHISDTQGLASSYPKTYDYTFSYLESIKERYNISAIIITGDLVNTWNSKKEWDAYSHAVHQTSIPIYTVAGNHDTNNGQDYQYYSQYTGNTADSSVTTLNNFDLVEINSVFKSPELLEITTLKKTLLNSPNNFAIIATHFYMDENGTLSRLGEDINRQLIVKPTIILSGHVHANFVRIRMIDQYPVIEDLTNYQFGIPGGSSSGDIAAGTFYSITTRNNQVEKISSKIIWISPRQSFGSEQVLYDVSVPAPRVETTPVISTSLPDSIWNSFVEFFRGLLNVVLPS